MMWLFKQRTIQEEIAKNEAELDYLNKVFARAAELPEWLIERQIDLVRRLAVLKINQRVENNFSTGETMIDDLQKLIAAKIYEFRNDGIWANATEKERDPYLAEAGSVAEAVEKFLEKRK